ncbi:hypothetical protein F4778DRAFT_486056 [Xylariomycetidae sp. FL2044]|nr:hypothetical protein F4778DRAFT_486056 [Xylariomycetidae sp. FL2044]
MDTSFTTRTVTFIGASVGCGHHALRHALDAGLTCVALCRTPAKLTDKLPTSRYPNLHVVAGNAHDVEAVAQCLTDPNDATRLVDTVISSIGGRPVLSKMTIDDPHVCEKGMDTLVAALERVRARGAIAVAGHHHPKIVGLSSTGISQTGRDLPLLMLPLYKLMGVPHRDKRLMEEKLMASGETFCVLRMSLLVDDGETDAPIRVSIEDPARNVVEKKREIGYTISREEAGRWIFANLLQGFRPEYWRRIVSITR